MVLYQERVADGLLVLLEEVFAGGGVGSVYIRSYGIYYLKWNTLHLWNVLDYMKNIRLYGIRIFFAYWMLIEDWTLNIVCTYVGKCPSHNI